MGADLMRLFFKQNIFVTLRFIALHCVRGILTAY